MKVKVIDEMKPIIYIMETAYDKMNEYIDQSDLEIGWLGTATKRGSNIYVIEDTYLFEQEVSDTTTEIKEEGLNNFAMELMQKENGEELWNNMRVWGHSHVDMGTSPSSQDNEQMKLFIKNPNEFFIRIIGNKKGDMKIDIYDFELGLIYEDMEYEIVYEEEKQGKINNINNTIKRLRDMLEKMITPNEDVKTSIKEEIALKVKKKKEKYVSYYNTYNDYGYYSNYGNYGKSKVRDEAEVRAEKLFDMLEIQDIYLIMENLEAGGTSADMLVNENLTPDEAFELDELIIDYCTCHPNEYNEYLEYNYK